jgi:uncharacterized membrane protein
VSDGTSQNPQTGSGQSANESADDKGSSVGRDVVVVYPKELQEKLTERLQPLLRTEKVGELVMNVQQAVFETTTTIEHRGPIPSSDEFGRYEKILPGSADRILKMAEKEQDHRHNWERSHLNWDGAINIISLTFGWLLSLGLVGGAAYCASINQPAAAVAFTGVAAFGGVANILRGKRLFGKADHQVPSQRQEQPRRPNRPKPTKKGR